MPGGDRHGIGIDWNNPGPLPRSGIIIVATVTPVVGDAMFRVSPEDTPIIRVCERCFFLWFDIIESWGTFMKPLRGLGNRGRSNHGRDRGYYNCTAPR